MHTQIETTRKALRVTTMGLIFLAVFTPLFVGMTMYFPFIVAKGLFIRTFIQLALAVYVVLIVIDPASRPRKSPLMWALIAFLVIAGASLLNSAAPFRSFWSNFERMEGFILVLHLGALFVMASSVLRKKEWLWLGSISLVVSIIVGAYALGDIGKAVAAATATGTTGPALEIVRDNVRISGTLGNSTYLGVYALIHFFLAFLAALMIYRGNREAEVLASGATHKRAVPLNAGNWTWIVVLMLVMGFNLFILFNTGTRGSFLGLAGGVFVMSAYLAWKERNRVLRFGALGVFVALIVIVSMLGIFKNSKFVQERPLLARYAVLISFNIKEVFEKFGEDRIMVWGMAVDGAKERPLLGWGQDNFGHVFAKYYDPGMYAREHWFDRSHNVFIDWLIAAGFLGLLSYLSFFIIAAWLILSRKSRLTVIEKSVFLGILVAYFIHNLFVFDNLTSYILFFLLLAYIHDRYAHDRVAAPIEKNTDYGTRILGASFVALLVLVYALYKSVFAPLSQNTTLAKALALSAEQPKVTAEMVAQLKKVPMDLVYDYFVEIYKAGTPTSEVFEQLSTQTSSALTSPTVSEATKMKFFKFYQEKIAYHELHNPEDPRYPFFISNFYKSVGEFDSAITYARKAYDLSPRKQSFAYALALLHAQKEEFDAAVDYVRTAYQNKPENVEALSYYVSLSLDAAKNEKGVYDTVKLGGIAQILADGYKQYGHPLITDPRLWSVFKQDNQAGAAQVLAKRLGELIPEKKDLIAALAK